MLIQFSVTGMLIHLLCGGEWFKNFMFADSPPADLDCQSRLTVDNEQSKLMNRQNRQAFSAKTGDFSTIDACGERRWLRRANGLLMNSGNRKWKS